MCGGGFWRKLGLVDASSAPWGVLLLATLGLCVGEATSTGGLQFVILGVKSADVEERGEQPALAPIRAAYLVTFTRTQLALL